MTYNFITTSKEKHVFILTLNRPEKRNAFTPTMVNEIAHAIHQANTDQEITLVLLKAEGPVFCAGMDLNTFRDPSKDAVNKAFENKDISLGEVFHKLLKPSIAIVEGNVIAGGFMMVLGCTYVFARKETRFRLPELALGIFPFQVMASLSKVLPEKKILQLCLETDYFSAEKAKSLGLIDGYIEDEDLENRIASFKDLKTNVLIAGIKSLRQLSSIKQDTKYAFLKAALDGLNKE